MSNIPAGMFIGLGAGFVAFAISHFFEKDKHDIRKKNIKTIQSFG